MHGVRMCVVLCCIVAIATGSRSQEAIFPGLQGIELIDALKNNFTPGSKLGITAAKDTLYLIIEREDGEVECVYSGHSMELPNGVDPSQWLYSNGAGINLEHVYPQSKGANEGQPGHSDMHHLFPARVIVNSTRANYPFDEIADNQTSKWFKDDITLESIPTTDIVDYSEFKVGFFEPRESVKGNIARAVFYFYTIYQDEADAADPDFFATQRETLCLWHLEDPADDDEIARSAGVAEYQDDKENPFVLDCTVALRAWCPEYEGCTTSSVDPTRSEEISMDVFSDYHNIIVRFESAAPTAAVVSTSDLTGRTIHQAKINIPAGSSEFTLHGDLLPGLYIFNCTPESTQSLLVQKCLVQ